MKKTIILVFITLTLSVLYSCRNGHSKAYVSLEKEVSLIEAKIQETDNCDDLQMLNFSILGFRSDLENARQDLDLSEDEAETLEQMAERLDSACQAKAKSLNCAAQSDDDALITSDEDDYNF